MFSLVLTHWHYFSFYYSLALNKVLCVDSTDLSHIIIRSNEYVKYFVMTLNILDYSCKYGEKIIKVISLSYFPYYYISSKRKKVENKVYSRYSTTLSNYFSFFVLISWSILLLLKISHCFILCAVRSEFRIYLLQFVLGSICVLHHVCRAYSEIVFFFPTLCE